MNYNPSIILAATQGGSNAALIAFGLYTLLVFALAGLASLRQKDEGFLGEYFLGSRNLGMWGFALTFAATAASGGSFMGFPSKIYTHGWSLALWIASYMLMPIIAMGLLGKRLNQVSRRANAITIPDVMRVRFDSSAVGILATMLLIFFMAFNLVAQFKAGSLMLKTLLDQVPLFEQAAESIGNSLVDYYFIGTVEPQYLMCLIFFAFAVIVYTTYGGFRAVVWTDVLQGFVMVIGVLFLLPLALHAVGGLSRATDELHAMVPPRDCELRIESTSATDAPLPFGTWLIDATSKDTPTVYRIAAKKASFQQGIATTSSSGGGSTDRISAIQVDIPKGWEPPPEKTLANVRVTLLDQTTYLYGDRRAGTYVTCPGPSRSDSAGFLPLSIAVSFFFFWTFSAAGQPSNMVRLMAFDSSQTLRRAMVTVSIYYSLIYFPLVVIFCCARLILPGMEIESDRIMPALAETLTAAAGYPWLAGLLVAAPFAAVMSTVDSFLLMISSAVVRDVYQQHIAPAASEARLRKLSYLVTMVVGVAALIGALKPPSYLQDIIVFTGGGLSGCFLIPILLGLYWPRFNAQGAIAGMVTGFITHGALYVVGSQTYGTLQAYRILGMDAFITEAIITLVVSVVVTLSTPRPKQGLVETFFGSQTT